jgi:hypothetical protein
MALKFFADHCVPTHIIPLLKDYLHQYPDRSHYSGKLFLVEPHRIRVRI